VREAAAGPQLIGPRYRPLFCKPRDEGQQHPTHIGKAEILSARRSRGLHARAAWIDRELPELVDTYKYAALLQMPGVDPAAIPPAHLPVEVAPRQG
jgi:hypothetical protein